MVADFLNRSCAFDACCESILLGAPLKVLFQQHRSMPTSVYEELTRPRAGLAALTDVVILAGMTYSRPSSRMGEETRRDPPNPRNKHPYRRPHGRPRSAPYAGGTPRAGSAH